MSDPATPNCSPGPLGRNLTKPDPNRTLRRDTNLQVKESSFKLSPYRTKVSISLLLSMNEGRPNESIHPPRASESLELTAEQVKRIELNRLKGERYFVREAST